MQKSKGSLEQTMMSSNALAPGIQKQKKFLYAPNDVSGQICTFNSSLLIHIIITFDHSNQNQITNQIQQSTPRNRKEIHIFSDTVHTIKRENIHRKTSF